jgi:hypothetical protein
VRDTFIPQCWGSKHSDPAAVAFASFLSRNCGNQRLRSTRSWARHFYPGDPNIMFPQLWPLRFFDPRIVGIKPCDPKDHGIKSGLRDTLTHNYGDQNILIPLLWPARQFDPPMLGIKTFSSCNSRLLVIVIPECWGSNHEIHKNMGSNMACAAI